MATVRCRCGKTKQVKRHGKRFTCPECQEKRRLEVAQRPPEALPPRVDPEPDPELEAAQRELWAWKQRHYG